MHLRGRRELMVTTSRVFDGTHAYSHGIRWVPAPTTRLILQRIVRTVKVVTNERNQTYSLHGPRGDYWELWEVFQGHVYPSNLMAGAGLFIPRTRLSREIARARLRFHVGEEPDDDQPFLTPAKSTAEVFVPLGPRATEAEHAAARHDHFSVDYIAGKRGTFDIYAEVYELTLAHCKTHRRWLNLFQPYAAGDGSHTAGSLPAKFGADNKRPLEAPTLVRYEAGRFNAINRHGRSCVESDFPAQGTQIRYPVAGATQVFPLAAAA